MDERILVEVYVPAVLQGMEVLLPAQAKLGVVHCFVSRLLETAWHLEKGSLKDAISVSGAAGQHAGFRIVC